MKKRHLEIILDSLKPHPNPKSYLEQYTIDGNLASEILFFAKDDILNNFVIDLGCGTGKLAIGAKLIGAKRVLGIDIDKESIDASNENIRGLINNSLINKLGIDINEYINDIIFINEDVMHINNDFINKYKGKSDKKIKNIVIQNPPFGSQKKYADRIFLDKALEIGDVIYTIHNTPTREFIKEYIKNKGRTITHIFQANFRIPKIYEFHKKKFIKTPVDIFRIE